MSHGVSSLSRVLEVEVMDTPDEARDYDAMDHRLVNRLFVDHLLQAASLRGIPYRRDSGAATSGVASSSVAAPCVLDVGTGTAQIPIELCGRGVSGTVVAIDRAGHMLALAKANVAAARLEDRVKLQLVDAKRMPYADGAFDVVMSNSIIHHIPNPADCLREMARTVRRGGLLFVRDLMRPADRTELERLVDLYAAGANAHQRAMFADSLHAALTLEEMRALADECGLPRESVAATSDRHWTLAATGPERTG